MKAVAIGAPIRTVAFTVLFAAGVATGVAVSASASPSPAQPCATGVRGQEAAPTAAATQSSWSVPPSPIRPGSGPY